MGAWIETVLSPQGQALRKVAPYVGAWIETRSFGLSSQRAAVAPYVGAWIETAGRLRYWPALLSHPTWVRGLKPFRRIGGSLYSEVAPYVGAWIETKSDRNFDISPLSHPTWVRGLKLIDMLLSVQTAERRTLRGCVD